MAAQYVRPSRYCATALGNTSAQHHYTGDIPPNSPYQRHPTGRGSGGAVPPGPPALPTTDDQYGGQSFAHGLGQPPPVRYGQGLLGPQPDRSPMIGDGQQYALPGSGYYGHVPPQYPLQSPQDCLDVSNGHQPPVYSYVPGTQQQSDFIQYPIQPMEGLPPQGDGGGNAGTPWKNPSIADLVYGPEI